MKFTRIVSTPDGNSMFAEAELASSVSSIAEGVAPMNVSRLIGTTGAVLIEDVKGEQREFHVAPMPVLVVVIEGRIYAETSDGKRREFGVGDVIRVEDTEGLGHESGPVTDRSRIVMLLLSEEEDP